MKKLTVQMTFIVTCDDDVPSLGVLDEIKESHEAEGDDVQEIKITNEETVPDSEEEETSAGGDE